MKKIKTEQDLIDIATTLKEKYVVDGMWITIPFHSYKLKKLDEYMFKKFNPNQKYPHKTVPNEVVYAKIGGIQFQLKGDGDYSNKIQKDEDGNEFIES